MTEDELVTYLANIVLISRVDGKLTSSEEEALESIRQELKARKSDLNKAIKIIDKNEHKITPVGRFSEKIRNLEDMLYTSLSDHELSDTERSEILSFAKLIKINQGQINEIIVETKNRIKVQSDEISCPQCKLKIPGVSKFCPQCGTNIDMDQFKKDSAKQLEFKIPDKGITIEFPESASANFDLALKYAKSMPTFQECLRSKRHWYCVTWPIDQILGVVKLTESLKGMRNRKVYINVEEKQWDEVFGFAYCLKRRQQAYRPKEYCFGIDEKRLNIWGCKQSHMEWSNWAGWFSYGDFINKKKFVFDKKRIRHELETNLFKIRYCPYFSQNYVKTLFNFFPDEVKVSEKGPWGYKECNQDSPSAISIVVKKDHGDGYVSEYETNVDGVSPRGFSEAESLIRTSLKQCGLKQIAFK